LTRLLTADCYGGATIGHQDALGRIYFDTKSDEELSISRKDNLMRYLSWSFVALALGAWTVATACSPDDVAESKKTTEILWDTWGVPHIFAGDNEGLFRAFGWAQMKSHGDLILELYGQARGRAAEYWGEERLASDQWVRTMGIYGRAEAWYREQSPEFRRYLDAFATGMNEYAEEHAEDIDDRFKPVLPVDAVDVLAHTHRVIHFSFVGRSEAVTQARQRLLVDGSNAWAIAPSRSQDEHAMLLINPHLGWSGDHLFYESHLTGPGIDFYGATLVGFPVMVLGFSDQLGWSHTVNTFDGADSFELTLENGGYRFDGEVRDFDSEEQTLLLSNGDGTHREQSLTIRRSHHGPVIAQGLGKAIAYRVVGLEASGMLEQWWDMSRATSLQEFETILGRLQVPMFNVIYADRDGHILYVFNGRVPKRSQGTFLYWWGTVPGDSSKTMWTDVLSYEELPRVLDPESGWLQNANDPPWTSTYPAVLDTADFPPYIAPQFMHFRAQQSANLLANDEQISFGELVNYKHWTKMLLADRLVDDLIAAARKHGDETAKKAADVLANWDRSANADSEGAVLFERWAQRMDLEKIVYAIDEESRNLMAETFMKPWDPSSPHTTPAGLKNEEKAAEVLGSVAEGVLKDHGSLSVAWGDVYRLKY
jgi:acyl-homoserine-lactone acylase